jgi:diguanylate cyclase (GGDEF)-like protein
LTGLYNRRYVHVRLETELRRSARVGDGLGLVIFDIDHFKLVNDRHGHLAGDAVLRAAAQALAEHLRPYDLIGRFGGEEFVILAPSTTLNGAVALAERARQVLRELVVPGVPLRISASFGVAAAVRGEPDAETLVRQADAALYRAKAAGRNRVEAAYTDSGSGEPSRGYGA